MTLFIISIGLSVTEIEQKLLNENVEIPAGRIESKYRDYTVKLDSGYKTVEDFKNLVLKKENNFIRKTGDVHKLKLVQKKLDRFSEEMLKK